MENKSLRSDLWNAAGKAGFVLGVIPCIYMLLSNLLTGANTSSTMLALLISLGNILLWAAKFAGCILLMKYFMKKFASVRRDATHSDVFRFGMAVAFLSALIYAAFYFAYVAFINPESIDQALAMVRESYSSFMTSDALETFEQTNFGVLGFFSNLIYCFLFGTVLSSILSRSIPSDNPFADEQTTDNQ